MTFVKHHLQVCDDSSLDTAAAALSAKSSAVIVLISHVLS